MKDKLIELLNKAKDEAWRERFQNGENPKVFVADYLLDNGVIVPPVHVGQTVWVLNQLRGMVFENTVVCVKILSQNHNKNTITLEYRNKLGERSTRKYTWGQVGKSVFFTREEAEKALREKVTEYDGTQA